MTLRTISLGMRGRLLSRHAPRATATISACAGRGYYLGAPRLLSRHARAAATISAGLRHGYYLDMRRPRLLSRRAAATISACAGNTCVCAAVLALRGEVQPGLQDIRCPAPLGQLPGDGRRCSAPGSTSCAQLHSARSTSRKQSLWNRSTCAAGERSDGSAPPGRASAQLSAARSAASDGRSKEVLS